MSAKGLAAFRADLTRFQKEIMPNEHAKFWRRVSLGILKDVIQGTPVDTGLAKGNWQTTGGEPASGVVETLDKNGSESIAKGQSVIMKTDPVRQVLWITNNLPYIEALEDGHSGQARNGWVELALLKVKRRAGLIK
jgi:hypothetical protein